MPRPGRAHPSWPARIGRFRALAPIVPGTGAGANRSGRRRRSFRALARIVLVVLVAVHGSERIAVAAGPGGRYRLQMTRLGRADAQDQQRIEAERDVTDGEVTRATNTLEGCRQAVQLFRRAASLWRELREPYEEGVALYGLALAHR